MAGVAATIAVAAMACQFALLRQVHHRGIEQ
jgi:hypothetical protein